MSKDKLKEELSKDPDVNKISEFAELNEPDVAAENNIDATGVLPKIDWDINNVSAMNKADYSKAANYRGNLAYVVIGMVVAITFTAIAAFVVHGVYETKVAFNEKLEASYDEFKEAYDGIYKPKDFEKSKMSEVTVYIENIKAIEEALDKFYEELNIKPYDNNNLQSFKKSLSKEIEDANDKAKTKIQNAYDDIVVDEELFDNNGNVLPEAELEDKQTYLSLFDELLTLTNDIVVMQNKAKVYDTESYEKIISDIINKLEMVSTLCQESIKREALKTQSEELTAEAEKKLDELNERFSQQLKDLEVKIATLQSNIDSKNSEIDSLKSQLKDKEEFNSSNSEASLL